VFHDHDTPSAQAGTLAKAHLRLRDWPRGETHLMTTASHLLAVHVKWVLPPQSNVHNLKCAFARVRAWATSRAATCQPYTAVKFWARK